MTSFISLILISVPKVFRHKIFFFICLAVIGYTVDQFLSHLSNTFSTRKLDPVGISVGSLKPASNLVQIQNEPTLITKFGMRNLNTKYYKPFLLLVFFYSEKLLLSILKYFWCESTSVHGFASHIASHLN